MTFNIFSGTERRLGFEFKVSHAYQWRRVSILVKTDTK